MTTETILIQYNDRVITSFVRERFDYPEFDVAWHEVPVLSDDWTDFDANKATIEAEESASRRGPRGMLDRAAHAPRYLGLPVIESADGSIRKLPLSGPLMGWYEDGTAHFSMPRDGLDWHGSGLVRIKYSFPDGGQSVWHRNIAPALDLLAGQGVEAVSVALLRKVVNEGNRHRPTNSR